jgi:hypothetical protein
MKLILTIAAFLVWLIVTILFVAELIFPFAQGRKLVAGILIVTPIFLILETVLPSLFPSFRVKDPPGVDDPNVKCMRCGQTIPADSNRCPHCGWSWQESKQPANPTTESSATSG